jgi:hypothetical protein
MWLKHRWLAIHERTTKLLQIIHNDVCSPISVVMCSGFSIFTHKIEVDIWISVQWRLTSESFETFKEFKSEIEIIVARK